MPLRTHERNACALFPVGKGVNWLLSLDVSRDRRILALADWDATVYVYVVDLDNALAKLEAGLGFLDALDWRLRARFKANGLGCGQVRFAPDGESLYTLGFDGHLRRWTLDGERLANYKTPKHFPGQIDFLPGGERAIVAVNHRRSCVLDLARFEAVAWIKTYSGFFGGTNACAVSPDGAHFVTVADDGSVRVFDSQTLAEVRRFRGHRRAALDVAFTPCGQRLLTCGADWTLRVWDFATGGEEHHLTGHRGNVNRVRVVDEGRIAVTCSNDKSLAIWDLVAGRLMAGLPVHKGWVNDVLVLEEEGIVFSAANDSTLRVGLIPCGIGEDRLSGVG